MSWPIRQFKEEPLKCKTLQETLNRFTLALQFAPEDDEVFASEIKPFFCLRSVETAAKEAPGQQPGFLQLYQR
jgi:hypothetical protein